MPGANKCAVWAWLAFFQNSDTLKFNIRLRYVILLSHSKTPTARFLLCFINKLSLTCMSFFYHHIAQCYMYVIQSPSYGDTCHVLNIIANPQYNPNMEPVDIPEMCGPNTHRTKTRCLDDTVMGVVRRWVRSYSSSLSHNRSKVRGTYTHNLTLEYDYQIVAYVVGGSAQNSIVLKQILSK